MSYQTFFQSLCVNTLLYTFDANFSASAADNANAYVVLSITYPVEDASREPIIIQGRFVFVHTKENNHVHLKESVLKVGNNHFDTSDILFVAKATEDPALLDEILKLNGDTRVINLGKLKELPFYFFEASQRTNNPDDVIFHVSIQAEEFLKLNPAFSPLFTNKRSVISDPTSILKSLSADTLPFDKDGLPDISALSDEHKKLLINTLGALIDLYFDNSVTEQVKSRISSELLQTLPLQARSMMSLISHSDALHAKFTPTEIYNKLKEKYETNG